MIIVDRAGLRELLAGNMLTIHEDWVVVHPDDVTVLCAHDGRVLGYRIARALLKDEQVSAAINWYEQGRNDGRVAGPHAHPAVDGAVGTAQDRDDYLRGFKEGAAAMSDLGQGGGRIEITDEMVRRAADAMPHHEEPSFWWVNSVQREILRRVLDAAVNGTVGAEPEHTPRGRNV